MAGAIVKKGGRIVQIESDQYVARHGKLECGDCCLTTAGALPCKKVMHAVGPIWKDGKSGEDIYLQVCVRTCLDQADRHGFRSIAMPAIRYAPARAVRRKCRANSYANDRGGGGGDGARQW